MQYFLNDGTPITYTDQDILGSGNEAVVIKLPNGKAAKLFKGPDHPDYDINPEEQQGARYRLHEHQAKIPNFPKNLPPNVMQPIDIISGSELTSFDRWNVAGYTMQLVLDGRMMMDYMDPTFRAGVPFSVVKRALLNLRDTVPAIHHRGAVIGDFNNRNVLVKPVGTVFMVDADSWQFGQWTSFLFSARYLDPLLSDPNDLVLVQKHNQDSDWYAYANMVYELLTLCGIYDGNHRPEKGSQTKRLPTVAARVLSRVPAWDSHVKVPDFVKRADVLPDDLMQYFDDMVKKDVRTPMPRQMIENLEERVCDQTGQVHYRSVSPFVTRSSKSSLKTTVKGNLTARKVFHTNGSILKSDIDAEGKFICLYHENGDLLREHGNPVVKIPSYQAMYHLSSNRTMIGIGDWIYIFDPHSNISTDMLPGSLSVVATNSRYCYWTKNGTLYRDEPGGRLKVTLGQVLSSQTRIWAGETFGFGFYPWQDKTQCFVFDAETPNSLRIVTPNNHNHGRRNDELKELLNLRGQVLSCTCTFAHELVWFSVTIQEASQTVNRCFLITRNGELLSSYEANQGDDHWLGHIQGCAATADTLFVPTGAGLMTVQYHEDDLVVWEFPDTRPYINVGTSLLIGAHGLYAVSEHQAYLLRM